MRWKNEESFAAMDSDGRLTTKRVSRLPVRSGVNWLTIAVYFNDSVAMVVFAYDFYLETGSISNRRLLIDRRSSYGEPD